MKASNPKLQISSSSKLSDHNQYQTSNKIDCRYVLMTSAMTKKKPYKLPFFIFPLYSDNLK